MSASVPVGAMVVTVALRRGAAPARARALVANPGNGPRSAASASLAACASRSTSPITSSGDRERLGRVVGDAEPHEQVREAHDAEADLPVAARDRVDLRERPGVHVEHVVEEADPVAHAGGEGVAVDAPAPLEERRG